jgi:hypothetical protein
MTCRHAFAEFLSYWAGELLTIAASAILINACWAFQGSYSDDQQHDPEQLIGEVVRNELNAAQNDHSLWRYREIRRNDNKSEELEFVETPDGNIHCLLAQNRHALSHQELSKEDARIGALLSNREWLRRYLRKQRQDMEEEQRLLRMLPTAFRYRYAGSEGNLIKIDFVPAPSFSAQSREAEVFHHLQGSLWIDSLQKRIVKIEGQLMSEVKFGGGF